MKKQWETATMAALCAVIAGTTLLSAGCGKKKADNNPQTLEVYIWNAGYGDQWVKPMLEAFGNQEWVKEKYPEYKYDVVSNDQQNFGESRINQGENNTIDLFFTQSVESFYGTDTLVDLTECVFNQQVPGEDVLYKDKMIDSMRESMVYTPAGEISESYYATPWACDISGFVYNETLFKELNLTVPNTTDELFSMAEKVKTLKNSEYNHTYSIATTAISYMNYLFPVWWAQYEGESEYENYWKGIDSEGVRNSSAVFSQTGRLKTLEIMQKIYTENNGYYDRTSSTYDFMAGQTRMLTRDALMMPCGDWFSNEMKELAQGLKTQGYDDTMRMMKTPIVSSIIEKTPSIKNDAMLSAVISEIDAGKTAPETAGVTQKDFETVRAARGVMYSIGSVHTSAIPAASTAKELAIDFLRFMATDEANTIYALNTSGGRLPFKFNLKTDAPEAYNELMSTSKETFSMAADCSDYLTSDYASILPYYGKFALARYGGVGMLAGEYPGFESAFISNANLTAKEVFDSTIKYWTENNNARWNRALRNAGLL